MSNSQPNYLSMTQVLWPEVEVSFARKLLLVLIGSLVLTISAKVQIPFYPVPLTMQTLAAIMIGTLFGARLGAATVMFYLAQGFVGLPVFAGPVAGPAYFAGPTGGFLVGFVLAAGVAGLLAERGWDRKMGTTFALMVIAAAMIHIPGIAWLSTLTGMETAVMKGSVPFLLGDLLKAALATLVLPFAWKLLK